MENHYDKIKELMKELILILQEVSEKPKGNKKIIHHTSTAIKSLNYLLNELGKK